MSIEEALEVGLILSRALLYDECLLSKESEVGLFEIEASEGAENLFFSEKELIPKLCVKFEVVLIVLLETSAFLLILVLLLLLTVKVFLTEETLAEVDAFKFFLDAGIFAGTF